VTRYSSITEGRKLVQVLRSSLYIQIGVPPMHTVVRDEDVTVPLPEMQKQMEAFSQGYVHSEIFEMPDGTDIIAAGVEGQRRYEADKLREHNMALLFLWDTERLDVTSDTGTIAATKPTPLSVEDIKTVLAQIPKHPLYTHQTVVAIAADGNIVTLRDGAFTE
jgi:hypothetical protein